MSAFITATTVGTLRNNFTGTAAFQITVGASNLSVGQLGRWVVSGNSGMHTLTIYDVAAASVIATVVINTSGATPGQYLYGSITPITLVAGHTYSIESSETNGGDQWYDLDTSVTVDSSMGTLINPVFSHTSTVGAANHSYIPPNFQLAVVASNGDLSVTEGADTLSAAGSVIAAGSASITEGADTLSAGAAAIAAGSASITEAADTLSAAAAAIATGVAAINEADDTVTGASAAIATGTLSITEANDRTFVVDFHVIEANDTLQATATTITNPGEYRPAATSGQPEIYRPGSVLGSPGSFKPTDGPGATPGMFKPKS